MEEEITNLLVTVLSGNASNDNYHIDIYKRSTDDYVSLELDEGLRCRLTPAQAREIAASLCNFADEVERVKK